MIFNGNINTTDALFKQLGQLIKNKRKQLYPKDTQEIFASRLGIGETTMSRIENGKPGVAINTIFDCLLLLDLHTNLEALVQDPVQVTLTADNQW